MSFRDRLTVAAAIAVAVAVALASATVYVAVRAVLRGEVDDSLRARAGRPIDLTATEYRLLRYLMLNPRRVLTRAQLLDHVWEYDFGGDARVLETYISYLRKKVDRLGPPLIHTVRGVGYALRLPPGASE